MRHLVVIIAVICAVLDEGWAQNRGSSRYVPPEDFDGDITRAPRPAPTRGAGLRRQRPTKAPEPTAVDDEVKAYQPPESPIRTTARRVPQRVNAQQASPALPQTFPAEAAAPEYASPAEGPQVPSTGLEGNTQPKRRRRPKKRRRPQGAVPKVAEDSDKQTLSVPVEEKAVPITELINDDKKRSERFRSNPISRSNPSTYAVDDHYQPEKASWESSPPPEQPSSAAGSRYYRPQPATNRLPVGDSEPVGNSRGYLDSSPGVPDNNAPSPYVPKRPESSVPNDGAYVPVLTPIRVPSEGASRLPPEDFPAIRNKESGRPTLHSGYNVPLRGHGSTPTVADPDEIIHNTGAKPVHNSIPQSDEPAVPVRSHSEVRLPEVDRPILSPEYASSGYDSNEGLSAPNAKATEETKEPASASNRLPTPSEIYYDSVYPGQSDDTRDSRRNAGRRQEPEKSSERIPRPSYSSPRRDAGTKPQEFDNDAQVDRRQASQYRPPLQRTGSRYKPEGSEEPTRSRTQEPSHSTSVPRTRGTLRYQQRESDNLPERTRSPARILSDSNYDYQKDSSSTVRPTTRTRGSQRYVPDTVENVPETVPGRQAANAEGITRDIPSAGYVPLEEYIRNEERSASHSPKNREPPTNLRTDSDPQNSFPVRNTLRNRERPTNLRTDSDPENSFPVRNTLRSRPQYEVREAELTDSYEESVEDPNVYNPDYQLPRQTNPRGRQSHRAPLPEPPQPEYQPPSSRQGSRAEPQNESPQNIRYRHQPQYEASQNPHSRNQPQYEASQNPRTDPRQNSNRQNPSSPPRSQGSRARPEPSPPPRRSSGGSNFKCPDAFGFFADPVQCDKYYECRNGTAEVHLCSDGLAFNEVSAPKFLRCDSLRDVDCKSRPELQEAQPSKNCPRKFGLFSHETDCTKFWNCVDGTATEVQCPPGLTYNDDMATCDWADLSLTCKSEDLLGFTCPEPTAHDLLDGVYTRYPHPDNCQLHFMCIKGADGLRRPRLLSCNEGLVFDPESTSCRRPDEVPGCEEFYGPVRSAPPKRKPARQPEPEPEEIEEPTPRPRRRGSNRRARN